MQRSNDRILTTHTGSLPRPPALTKLYAMRSRGEAVDASEIERAGHASMLEIVSRQIEAGIDIGNNGEQQREGFFLHVRHRMTGFGGSWKRWPRADVEGYPVFKRMLEQQSAVREMVSNFAPPKVIGDINYIGAAEAVRECTDFRAVLEARKRDGRRGFVEAFLTAPSPGIVVAAIKNEHYDTEDAYLAAVGRALQVEYEAIANQGFLLQLDCPDLALEHHISFQDRPIRDFLSFVERVVATINDALRNIPRDKVRMHVCWGNYEGPHDRDVALETILPLIARMNVGALVLPFANPRHAHEVRCLQGKAIADDQVVVAGVIDSTTNFVEHPEVIAERIERVAKTLGDPARVMAGTDCGFDTSAGAGRVAEDVVWAKLAALKEGARLASDRLF
ncbi:MAG TPA: cobalamin-independent methionine synthase II family protein [Bradyrhizobium sp.]|uniref:cobalamin-independent methionine synthase II family protein n=1 Tax=Bradyrhizobium sp. TaxID=376 RepID=UPI002D7F85ED|nr:cobalamin-independent methionine synthase II family protein [Bradyrhizobium sp.]HET7886343.1 cobalamin-independent methionine synthase II family protein [Bradyrhizobium sp.]